MSNKKYIPPTIRRSNSNPSPLVLPEFGSTSSLVSDESAPLVIKQFTKQDPITPVNPTSAISLPPPVFRAESHAAQSSQNVPNEAQAVVKNSGFTPPNVGDYVKKKAEYLGDIDKYSKPVTASDDSRFHSGLEAVAKGLEVFQPQFGVINGWGDVFQRLASVGGSFAGGMINDKWDERDSNARNLSKAQSELGRLDAAEKTRLELEKERKEIDNKTASTKKIEAETSLIPGQLTAQQIKNVNDKLAPYLGFLKDKKQITPEEANFLSNATGLPYDAASWQQYIDKEVNGTTFTRSEFEPVYSENKTVPIQTTKVPRNIKIGNGDPLPLTPEQAAPIIAANEQNNANRQQSATQFQISEKRLADQFDRTQVLNIQKYNFDEYGRYIGDAKKAEEDKVKANQTITKNKPILDNYAKQIQEDQNYLDTHTSEEDKVLNADEIKTRRARIADNQSKAATVQGENEGANYFLNNYREPIAPNQIAIPNNSAITGDIVSKEKIRQYARSKGVSYDEAKKHAIEAGYKIQ